MNNNSPQQSLSSSREGSSHKTSSIRPSLPASRASVETQDLTQKELDEKPWKYLGYQGYSRFLASEDDFLIFRRFSSISARVALRLQDRLAVLEEELAECDRKFDRRDAEDVHNGSFRQEQEERERIVDDLQKNLMEYNQFMLQQGEIKRYPSASKQDITSIENWHWNHNSVAIDQEEQKYLTHVHDLFSLVPRIKTPLRRLLDRSRRFKIHSFWRNKQAPELPHYDKDVINYFSDKKIDAFITVLIVSIGSAMLIAPMWILQALHSHIPKLATITAFIVVFLGMVSYATVAKPFETLAATAAYSAVLMVFLQLGPSTK